MRKFAVAIAAAFALSGIAVTASAQSHGHGSHSGGGTWHGGSSHAQGGSWGGGSWHGGGSSWHGGGWHGVNHGFWGPRIGFSFGFPAYSYWGPGYYGYPYAYPYSYPYSYSGGYAYDEGAPQVYIQRDTGDSVAPANPARPPEYSYYCTDPAGYYPQVANCPRGWLKVVPNGAPRPAPR